MSSSDQYYLVKRQRCSNSVHSTDSLTYSTPPHSSTPSSLLMSHPSHSRFLFYNETHSYIIDAQATGNVARFSNVNNLNLNFHSYYLNSSFLYCSIAALQTCLFRMCSLTVMILVFLTLPSSVTGISHVAHPTIPLLFY